jgi:hypothetical protein
MQGDSVRLSHELSLLPVWGRSEKIAQLLDDLFEEDAGKGFSEVTRSGPFVTVITVWNANTQDFKRTETTISRTGPFVSSLVKEIFDQEGVSVLATITATVTRAVDNSIESVNVNVTRP